MFKEKIKDPELQNAIMEMERLDRLLATKISTEKEVKKQSKELHQRLWKELNVRLNIDMCFVAFIFLKHANVQYCSYSF